jgi:RNA-directed DNA polymerase
VALDGMERLFGAEDDQAHYRKPSQRPGRDRGISLIRYADDAVVTAPTRETLSTYVIPKLTTFLAEQGLKLSEAKTWVRGR